MRIATLADLDALTALENATFPHDRYAGSIISRRAFRHALTRGNAITLVHTDAHNALQGYAMILFRRGSKSARLYALAIAEGARGQGIGKQLGQAATKAALDKGCAHIMLETRSDNKTMIALAQKLGYRFLRKLPDYYPAGIDGLKFRLDL